MSTIALRAAVPVLAAIALLAGSVSAGTPAVPRPPLAQHLTVIELFQSQGCSSCPPANALLNAIADRGDVVALSFAVTYWDQLGWKDVFGSPRFTTRQQDYASAGRGQVATPEFIIDGTDAVLGSDPQAFAAAVARGAARQPGQAPDIAAEGQTLHLGTAAATGPATVWLVRYDQRMRNVPIGAGENSGRTLPHRDIVRDLVKLGAWSGAAISFALPPAHEAGLTSAVLIQRGQGGPIIAARRI